MPSSAPERFLRSPMVVKCNLIPLIAVTYNKIALEKKIIINLDSEDDKLNLQY